MIMINKCCVHSTLLDCSIIIFILNMNMMIEQSNNVERTQHLLLLVEKIGHF